MIRRNLTLNYCLREWAWATVCEYADPIVDWEEAWLHAYSDTDDSYGLLVLASASNPSYLTTAMCAKIERVSHE